MADARAWLPPEGPAHGASYDWYEGQGAHRIGNSTVHGHEDVILTRSAIAQRNCERYGLEELPGDVAEEIAEARADQDDERTAEIVDEFRSATDDVADPEAERPEIPSDDELDDLDYGDLQDLAQAYGIQANQSGEEIADELAQARDDSGASESEDDSEDNEDEEASG